MSKASIRSIVTKAAEQDLDLYQIDIETAYQHQSLKEGIFLEQPTGFEAPSTTSQSHICRLKKVLYCLNHGAVELHKRLKDRLWQFGYTIMFIRMCLY